MARAPSGAHRLARRLRAPRARLRAHRARDDFNMTAAAPTWMAKPRKPALILPPGACDAHVHVFGPGARFSYAEGRNPADAPKEALFALHEWLGVELVPTTISDGELRALDAQGYRGARFRYVAHLGHGPPIDEVIAFGKRLAPLGWHL